MIATTLLGALVDQGLGQALVQRQDLEPEHYDTAFWANVVVGFTLAAALILLATPAATVLGEQQLAPVLKCLAFMLPIAAISSVPRALFQRRLDFRTLAERAVIGNLVGGIAGISAAFVGFGAWSLVIQALLTALTGAGLMWAKLDWRPGINISYKHFRQLFSFGSRMTGSNLLILAARNSDNLLIGVILGPVALGLYSIAYRVLELTTDVSTRTISMVTFPVFSKIQLEAKRLQRGYLDTAQMSLAIALPCFGIIAALAPEIVPIVFGPQWDASVPVITVLALVGPLYPLISLNSSVLMAVGKANWVLRLNILNTFCVIAGFMVSVRWGIVAVAVSYAIVTYMMVPISVTAAKAAIGFDGGRYFSILAKPCFAGLCAIGAIALAQAPLATAWSSEAVLGLLAPIALLGYLLILRAVAPGLVTELHRFARWSLPTWRMSRKPLVREAGDAPT